mgnify:CR=1 FL=1
MKLNNKITESSNIKSKDIDKKNIHEILNIFNNEDETVVKAVGDSLEGICDIINITIKSLNNIASSLLDTFTILSLVIIL